MPVINGEIVRHRSAARHSDRRMTKRAPADQQRVSELLKKYVNMGMVPSNGRMPRYGDFTGIGDFHDQADRVLRAQEDFMRLPAQVRKLAENDPGLFLEMVYGGRPEMLEQLELAGLVEIQKPEQIQRENADRKAAEKAAEESKAKPPGKGAEPA